VILVAHAVTVCQEKEQRYLYDRSESTFVIDFSLSESKAHELVAQVGACHPSTNTGIKYRTELKVTVTHYFFCCWLEFIQLELTATLDAGRK
jgi:hypothetical protein